MDDPFRDPYAAAVDRADLLARENDDLRAELARLRGQPREKPPERAPEPPQPPPDSLKRRTLDRLEQLSEEIDHHQAVVAPPAPEPERNVAPSKLAPAAPPPAPLAQIAGPLLTPDELSAAQVRAQLDRANQTIEALNRRRSGAVVGWMLLAALFGFLVGLWVTSR